MNWSRLLKRILLGLGVLVLAIQLVPVDRNNPPVTGDLGAPPAVDAILRRSCYDCHSNESVWPWYSYVAPVSWLVAHDVEEGREHLNFSTWNAYSEKDRRHLLEEIAEETEKGAMPLPNYVRLHGDAALSPGDLAAIGAWVKSLTGGGEGRAEDGDHGEGR